MKKNVILLLLLVNFSCSSQESKSNPIKGNWYNLNNQKFDDISYIETFFSDDYFQSYDESGGLMPSRKYSIEGDKIFLVKRDGTVSKSLYGVYKIEGDLLYITANDKTIVLKRIKAKSGTLEDYINEAITEREYWKSFNDRKLEWINSKE